MSKGLNATCFEEGYDYCDNNTYIYIEDPSYPIICADKNNTDYYYEDEDGNKIKVDNCSET